jgi:hypothetical protein
MAQGGADSHSRVAGRPWWADWCGNVKSITEQIQHTLNIANKVTQAKVRGSATPQCITRRRT